MNSSRRKNISNFLSDEVDFFDYYFAQLKEFGDFSYISYLRDYVARSNDKVLARVLDDAITHSLLKVDPFNQDYVL